jgi:hypothetical protein
MKKKAVENAKFTGARTEQHTHNKVSKQSTFMVRKKRKTNKQTHR